MKYLLDTHVLLWNLFEEEMLSEEVADLLRDADTELYISAVSFWEISVKRSIGKLNLRSITPRQLPSKCVSYGFNLMPISPEEAASYYQLNSTHHKNPFDRMLIWQAIQNNLILISNEENMPAYKSEGLKLLW